MKKVLCILVLSTVIVGGVFAQEVKNWISGEVGLIEIGTRYERMLTPNFSVGGTVFWNSFFFFWNSLGIQATGRFYPWAGVFYAECGLGYGTVTGTEEVVVNGYNYGSWVYSTSGLMVTPGVGWKIDVGNPGGFFLNPMISIPIVFGKKTYDWWGYTGDSEFKIGTNFKVALGMGYAF